MQRFEVRTSVRPGATVVALAGECDLSVRDDVVAALQSAVTGSSRVLIDLSGLTFLDSGGVHALVMAHQAALREGVALHAVGARGVVADLMDLTGVGDLLRAPEDGGVRDDG
jgi:anti-sigma B factor antagonist